MEILDRKIRAKKAAKAWAEIHGKNKKVYNGTYGKLLQLGKDPSPKEVDKIINQAKDQEGIKWFKHEAFTKIACFNCEGKNITTAVEITERGVYSGFHSTCGVMICFDCLDKAVKLKDKYLKNKRESKK